MTGKFKFIEHTADIAIELQADSLEELFVAGADALKKIVTELEYKEDFDFIEIDIFGTSKEELLVSFLNEINFYLSAKKWLCCRVESIKIINEESEWELSAELNGIQLKSDVDLKQEIKSVTYHQMDIINKNNNYTTRVVFDI